MPSFFQEETIAAATFQCPACHQFLLMGATTCRFCNRPIDRETAKQLLIQNQKVMNAVASANTYKLTILGAMIYGAWQFWSVLSEDFSRELGVLGIAAIGFGAHWLHRYRSLITDDVDYPVAVKAVKRTLILWVLAAALPYALDWLLRVAGLL
jgi:hypothetical protein